MLVYVRDGLKSDRLIDVVRGRVHEIGEEEAETVAAVQQVLAKRSDTGARIPVAPERGRCVDRIDADAVRRRAGLARHGDGRAIDAPEGEGICRIGEDSASTSRAASSGDSPLAPISRMHAAIHATGSFSHHQVAAAMLPAHPVSV